MIRLLVVDMALGQSTSLDVKTAFDHIVRAYIELFRRFGWSVSVGRQMVSFTLSLWLESGRTRRMGFTAHEKNEALLIFE